MIRIALKCTQDIEKFLLHHDGSVGDLLNILDSALYIFPMPKPKGMILGDKELTAVTSSLVNFIFRSTYLYLEYLGVSEDIAYNVDVFSVSLDDTITITVNYLPKSCELRYKNHNIH